MTQTYAIIGAGQAGLSAAAHLRALGFDGSITLYGDEPEPPYQRPPLSKTFLTGEFTAARLFLKPPDFYRDNRIDLHTEHRVVALDAGKKELRLADGSRAAYTRALLTTGGEARRLDLPGAQLEGVHVLRSLADARALRAHMSSARRLVVLGGGYIGLEIAASARKAGLDVLVLEAAPRILERVTSPVLSEFFTARHARAGVRIMTGMQAVRFEGRDSITGVRTGDGALHPADMVAVGIGLVPAAGLARDAGLKLDNGIAVDAHTRSSDPDIFAAGDVASRPSALYGRRIRLESVQNAIDQARAAAAAMCGKPQPYDPAPWFWSDQYDVKLQIAGLAAGYDQIVRRGAPESERFSIFYLRNGRLIAADSINRPADHMAARRLIASRVHPDPNRLADEKISPRELVSQ